MLKTFSSLILLCLFCGRSLAENTLIDRVQKIKDSLVEVKTVYTKAMRTGGLASFERSGAGIIIDPLGLIVTNTHTIINAPHIFIVLKDGAKYDARAVFIDVDHDFSFLKINAPTPLTPVSWADSSQVQLGENIITIGNSDYDNQSILSGQITSVIQSRSTGAIELLEVNLNLYKGDSGGPILDRQGKLLGLVMAGKKSHERSSIAIASDKIREQYLRYKQTME